MAVSMRLLLTRSVRSGRRSALCAGSPRTASSAWRFHPAAARPGNLAAVAKEPPRRGAAAGVSVSPASGGAEFHGGDDIHRVTQLICDFSVTTNALGPSARAVAATRSLFEDVEVSFTTARSGDIKAILDEEEERLTSSAAVEHYPQRSDSELLLQVARFLRPQAAGAGQSGRPSLGGHVEQRLAFGNGASELIDLVVRAAPQGPYCVSPKVKVQYKEYERACRNSGRTRVEEPGDAAIMCLVNPTNPTGDFLERADMEAFISENAAPGSWVIVDESMIFWAGSDWHERGVSGEFVEKMLSKHIKIFIIHSWTKIFSCTGLRIGSVLCPSVEARRYVESMQVPWSVTVFAQTYLKEALQDKEYLERTWHLTKRWREHIATRLRRLHPDWRIHGQEWLSWLWIDTGDVETAKDVYKVALECGCPIRHAEAGYNLPTYVRIAVRRPYDFAVLYQALLRRETLKAQRFIEGAAASPGEVGFPAVFGSYADVHPSVVEGVYLVHIDDLKPHEHVDQERSHKLEEYMKEMAVKVLPSIIVCSKTQVVIDGHHRLVSFRRAGMNIVPAVFVKYSHEDILVNPPNSELKTTKEDVIFNALKGRILPPKSTHHMVRSRGGDLMPIIVLAPQIAEIGGNRRSH